MAGQVVRVLPDVSGLDKAFDYLVPPTWTQTVRPGDRVRFDLHGRRVSGWVLDTDVTPPPGVELRALVKWSSRGPDRDVIALARWAATRWHGRLGAILGSASPERMVPEIPRRHSGPQPISVPIVKEMADALTLPGVTVLRVAPMTDIYDYVATLTGHGDAIVITPSVADARHLGARLRRAGGLVALAGRDWALGAGGGLVIGSRRAVWATVKNLAAIVVIDEQAEAMQEERNPTWHARDVAIERARRAGVPCVLLTPVPSLAALEIADRVVVPSRNEERRGWPRVVIIDRRDDEPGRVGLFSSQLAPLLRSVRGRVLCVLNRKGRARMLICASCGALVRSSDGAQLMVETDDGELVSAAGERRPRVCAECGSTALKRLRLGVNRAREELEALMREPVAELSADRDELGPERIVIGTEAALHRLYGLDMVVFLDIDSELMALRYRAGEHAMNLLALAAQRMAPPGRLVLQTRLPDHRVIQAANRADPSWFSAAERQARQAMGMPPFAAIASLSGAGASERIAPLLSRLDVSVLGPNADGSYLVRAPDPEALAAALGDLAPSKQRTRIAVDPPRV